MRGSLALACVLLAQPVVAAHAQAPVTVCVHPAKPCASAENTFASVPAVPPEVASVAAGPVNRWLIARGHGHAAVHATTSITDRPGKTLRHA